MFHSLERDIDSRHLADSARPQAAAVDHDIAIQDLPGIQHHITGTAAVHADIGDTGMLTFSQFILSGMKQPLDKVYLHFNSSDNDCVVRALRERQKKTVHRRESLSEATLSMAHRGNITVVVRQRRAVGRAFHQLTGSASGLMHRMRRGDQRASKGEAG